MRVFNDRGEFEVEALVDDAARPGVAFTFKSYWPGLSPGGKNVNATTPARDTDLGGGPTFHDNRVEVEAAFPKRRDCTVAAATRRAKAPRSGGPARQAASVTEPAARSSGEVGP